MDEEETKSCPNCKREIPAVNFTIHSVHCARNIKVCPVCKEPVPGPELDDHHNKMHKLLPCKQCGDSVCGTDLEDHIRDSCANTVKSCRFCELGLPRRELPTHEGYCGVRTEQCADCKEYVMIKYQQLHIDSNHGFIRLDDDPAPSKKELPKLNLVKPLSKSNLNRSYTSPINGSKSDNIAQRPTSIFDDFPRQSDNRRPTSSNSGLNNPSPSRVTPSLSNSGLASSTFGNPRPYVRPSSSNSGPSSLSSGFGSSDSRPSSSSVKPNSSDEGKISSNSGLSPKNSGAASLKTRLESFDSRQGLISATPLQWPSPSASGSGSSNFRPDSSNARPDSLNSGPSSSDARTDSSNSRPDSSNSWPSSSDARPGSSNARPSSSNTRPSNFDITGHSRILANTNNVQTAKTEFKNQRSNNTGFGSPALNVSSQEVTTSVARASNGVKKRTNDQPQINMDTSATKTVDKDLVAVSRGAVKKRPAPQPPRMSSRRDLPYYSAMQRQQTEERQRREQNEYNLAHGLPPVLNAAQKVEKLRKMDALQNRDFEQEYRSRQRRPSPERREQRDAGHALGTYQDMDEDTRQQFKNLKPMSPNQFMKRFSSLQVSPPPKSGDRFPEIKSSLRELRRGLNEVTAPYNANNNFTANNNNELVRAPSPPANEDVQLPCEFCSMLVPADDLVQHQTGCRPDLAQFVHGAGALPGAAPSPRAPPRAAPGDPVIPCEFCMQSLPVYLITEHQEQCIRENMLA